MKPLKAMCAKHGGAYSRQAGIWPGTSREYWLIYEAFHPLPTGYICRSAQITHSWAMRRHMQENQTRTLPHYSLVLITRGEGTFNDGTTQREYPVRAGDLLCLFPDHPHAYAPSPGQFWDEINIGFTGPVFDSWTGTGLLDPQVPVRHLAPTGKREDIRYWLERIYELVLPLAQIGQAEPTLGDTGRLVALIAKMCEQWQILGSNDDAEWINRAKRQLAELPLPMKPDLSELAGAFHLGEQAYRKKFKRLSGVTPLAYRLRLQIEEACRQLMQTDKPVKEIGYDLGFGSLFYFSHRFKQVTGMSPGEYRSKLNS